MTIHITYIEMYTTIGSKSSNYKYADGKRLFKEPAYDSQYSDDDFSQLSTITM